MRAFPNEISRYKISSIRRIVTQMMKGFFFHLTLFPAKLINYPCYSPRFTHSLPLKTVLYAVFLFLRHMQTQK
jgi:hypothetical protein